MGQNTAHENEMVFAETSAKTGEGVNLLFTRIAEQVVKIRTA